MKHIPIAIYVILIIFAASFHEPWRDEAQAWLMARDIPISSLYFRIGYDGTPALWHTLLSPLAQNGFPYYTEHILHVIIAILAACLFYYKSPFSILTKILVVFSYYFVFEYAVIARSYGISVFLIFTLSTIYKDRFNRPYLYAMLVFLLFNTNVHSFFFSLALTLIFIYESIKANCYSKTICTSSILMLLGGALAIIQLAATPQVNVNFESPSSTLMTDLNWKAPIFAVKNAFFPDLHNLFSLFAVLILLLSAYFFLKVNPALLFVMFLSYGGLFYVFIFKHSGDLRHHGIIFVELLFLLWVASIGKQEKYSSNKMNGNCLKINVEKRLISLINLSLCFSFMVGIKNIYLENHYQFSGAKNMAKFIEKNDLEDLPIIAYPSAKGSSILPFLGNRRLYYPDIEDNGTYIVWNSEFYRNQELDMEEVLGRVSRKFRDGDVLLLLDRKIDEKKYGTRLVYKNSGRIFGYGEERFYLYKKSPYYPDGKAIATVPSIY